PYVDEVINEKSYQSLKETKEKIDIINIIRRSEQLPAIANEAKYLNIKGFWSQQGVIHEDVPTILENNDALVMMDLCIKVAHATLVKQTIIKEMTLNVISFVLLYIHFTVDVLL